MAPAKKKMTLKQKLAEKEKLAAEKKLGDDDLIDERTEQDRRREAREKELAADLAVASDLMGDMGVSTGESRAEVEYRGGVVGGEAGMRQSRSEAREFRELEEPEDGALGRTTKMASCWCERPDGVLGWLSLVWSSTSRSRAPTP